MTDRQAERLAHIRARVPSKVGIFERVFSATTKRPRVQDMVRAKCLDCCGYSRSEAAVCEVDTCALFAANPYRKKMLKRNERETK